MNCVVGGDLHLLGGVVSMDSESMFEKVQRVYVELQPLYSRGYRDGIDRKKIILKALGSMLGEKYTIKSDDENNPADVLELDCLVVRVWWQANIRSYERKYVNLVFGTEENAIKILKTLW